MLDTPADAPAVWIGLAVAAAALLGLATDLPTAPPPDAATTAAAVDRTVAAGAPASATLTLRADAVRLSPDGLALRNEAGTAAATFAFGPVTPVHSAENGPLVRVLDGEHPTQVFESERAFAQAVAAARAEATDPAWTTADALRVRTVAWRGRTVTVVGT